MSVFIRGPYGRLAIMLNTLSSLNIEIIIIIIIISGCERRIEVFVKIPKKNLGGGGGGSVGGGGGGGGGGVEKGSGWM